MIKVNTSSSSWQTALFWGVFFLLVGYFVYHVRAILLPFILGIAVAYISSPLVDRLTKKFFSRTVASIFIIVAGLGLLIAFLSLILPYIKAEVKFIVKTFPKNSGILQEHINLAFNNFSQFFSPEQWLKIKISFNTYLSGLIEWIAHLLLHFLTNSVALANFFVLIIFTPIISFYLLRDWHKITASINNFIPENYRAVISTQISLMNLSLRGYLKGQALVSLTLAIYYSFGLWFIDLNSGALIGFLTGFFSFIPFLSVFSGFIFASIVAIYQAPDLWLWFWVIIIFSTGQLAEGSFLTPNLVGNRIGLHPVWIIFVVLSGAALIGFWGVLIALPLASMLSVLSRFALEVYYSSSFHKEPRKKKKLIKSK